MRYNNSEDYNNIQSHKNSMKKFARQFKKTESDTYKKTENDSRKAKKTAWLVLAAAFVLIMFIGAFLIPPVKKAVDKSVISSEAESVNDIIYSYLENHEYKKLSDYSDSIEALENTAFEKQYSVLMGARYYTWAVQFMNFNSDNKNLSETDVAYISRYLGEFYYYSQITAYKDNAATVTDENKLYLEQLRTDMGELLKKYYHLTDKDLQSIDTYSSAKISKCLIERSMQ